MRYEITYTTQNTYDSIIGEGLWQFLVLPLSNDSQEIENFDFKNSIGAVNEESINGFGFSTVRISSNDAINHFEFSMRCTLKKEESNPFEIKVLFDISKDYETIKSIPFRTTYESFLTPTSLTRIPERFIGLFVFDPSQSLFDNLVAMNAWSFDYFTFKTEVTSTETTITETLENKQGVCQDFTHVFCGLARNNHIPTRYVSGYLHQGKGLAGDSQMHAWVECYIPELGWTGFDPTNNLLADHNYIKVCHGRDYQDCAPLKGLVLTSKGNEHQTTYTVFVKQIPEGDTSDFIRKEQHVLINENPQETPANQQQWQQQQ